VQVPLWWAEQAVEATRTPKAMVWVWLLHLAWASHSKTFRLPNERLRLRGVSRDTKTRALRDLEKAGLIQVTREVGKSPTVTLLYL
jgi:DNA-binding transcriptional ArsR family regulator